MPVAEKIVFRPDLELNGPDREVWRFRVVAREVLHDEARPDVSDA
jgi:hypothetical protein